MKPACLLIANDVNPAAEDDFANWYEREHLDERLAVPGFLSARRYQAVSASHRFVVLYETTSAAVLASNDYLNRLRHPSTWTQRVMPHFRRMSRSVLELEADEGCGMGAVLDLVVVGAVPSSVRVPLPTEWEVTHAPFERARFYKRPAAVVAVDDAVEARLRPVPDTAFEAVWLVEWSKGATPDSVALLSRMGWRVRHDVGGRYRLRTSRLAPPTTPPSSRRPS
jgi:hypothetical protein